MYDHDPTPQVSACSRIQLVKPTDLSQATFHLVPSLYTRRPDALCQTLSEPFLVSLVDGDATDDEKGPRDGDGLLAGADADGTVDFALLDDVHELRS